MNDTLLIVLLCWISGLAMPLGALAAYLAPHRGSDGVNTLIHATIAFGGGILVAAVAFALVPRGLEALPVTASALCFCSGSVLFMYVDETLAKQVGSKSQLMAMLLDFVPESVSLGAVFAHDRNLGILLAVFIGAQNVPEAFNAHGELTKSGLSARSVVGMMLLLSLLGPIAGLFGCYLLQDRPQLIGALMLFAAGGILYLVFQDIAPKAKLKRHWSPPLGGTLGFLVGMVGEKLLG